MPALILYVLLSSTGLTLVKLGTSKDFGLSVKGGALDLRLNGILLLGMLIYIFSFLLSMYVMKRMNLSVFYPVSAGLIYVLVCVLGHFVLKEEISLTQLIGMAVIFAGVLIMNLHKG